MSQFISLAEAIDMTTRYRTEKDSILKEPFIGENILCISETFDKSVVEKILSKPGCHSLRIYYGMQPDLTIHAILVAADADGHDILPTGSANASEEDDESIAEMAMRCPPICPRPSQLNP